MLNRVGWAAAAAALALTALAASPAHATVLVGMAGGDMVVSDSDGQAATVNVVTSAAPAAPLAGAGYVVSVPTSHALDSKPPCQPLVASPAPHVTCPYDQVTAVTIVLADGNDTLTVKAPAGAPAFADLTLSPGDGTDTATVSVGATTGVSLQAMPATTACRRRLGAVRSRSRATPATTPWTRDRRAAGRC
jgi:hypothetical protein